MAYIARTDGTREVIDDPMQLRNLNYIRNIIGGHIERVCPRNSMGIIFLCNEEGHIKKLPLNQHGSQLYGDAIAGDIIVMTRIEARLAGWI